MAREAHTAAGLCKPPLLGLPLHLLDRIISHPDLHSAGRSALFESCHALARAVFMHDGAWPELTCGIPHSPDGAYQWSAALDSLLGSKWQPLPLTDGLILRITGACEKVSALPKTPPPRSISQLVTHLWLDGVALSEAGLAGWQLHDAERWPRLRMLGLFSCRSDVRGHARQRAASAVSVVQPIPNLRKLVVHRAAGTAKPHRWIWDVVLALASETRKAEFEGLTDARQVQALQRLPHLTHCSSLYSSGNRQGDTVAHALLDHPTLEHVTVDGDHCFPRPCQRRCRWKTLRTLFSYALWPGILRSANKLESLTLACQVLTTPLERSPALAEMHAQRRLSLVPLSWGYRGRNSWWQNDGERVASLEQQSRSLSLRMLLEAGRGFTCIDMWDRCNLLLRARGEEPPPSEGGDDLLVPLLLRHPGHGIRTVCLYLKATLTFEARLDKAWWREVFDGLIAAGVTRVKVRLPPEEEPEEGTRAASAWRAMLDAMAPVDLPDVVKAFLENGTLMLMLMPEEVPRLKQWFSSAPAHDAFRRQGLLEVLVPRGDWRVHLIRSGKTGTPHVRVRELDAGDDDEEEPWELPLAPEGDGAEVWEEDWVEEGDGVGGESDAEQDG